MKKLITIFLISIIQVSVLAQTTITGGDVSGTWSNSGSPFEVIGNIAIPDGDTLTIEAGVQVVFQDEYTFTIVGSLQAIGTETNNIYFTVQDTTGYSSGTYTGWLGLNFAVASSSSLLEYCIVEYSKGFGIYSEESDLYIDNSNFRYNSTGVFIIAGSSLEINNSIIEKNRGDGLYINSFSSLSANSCTVRENSNNGVSIIENSNAVLYSFKSLNNGGTGMIVYNSLFSFVEGSVSNNLNGGFSIDQANPTLRNLNILGNNKSGNGGGIYCDFGGSINGVNLIIQNNTAMEGGGIYAINNSSIVLDSSTVNYNQADLNLGLGGGIYIERSTVNLANSSINNCESYNGGGIYIDGIVSEPAYFTGVNLVISNNVSNNLGGGLYCLNNAHVDLDSTTISSNQANSVGGIGGGIYINAGSLNLSNLDILNCSASHAGGGIYSSGTTLDIDNVTFSACYLTAQGAGGGGMAIYDSPDCNLTDVNFTNCSDYDYHGGGISCYNSSISMQHVNFNDNSGTPGGGIYSSASSLSAIDVKFSGNYGGGLFCTSSTLIMSNAEFDYNWNVGIHANYSDIELERILINNTYGEGVQVGSNSQLDIMNCTFVNNLGTTITSDATSTVSIINSVVWDNATPAIGVSGTLNVAYSNIQDGLYPGTGNITIDPIFIDPATDDYSLSWINYPVNDPTKSPCIDTGDPLSPPDPDGTQADMGFLPYDQYYELDLKAFLEGPFFISQMIPFLNIGHYIPLYQPYNLSPWNYDGLEFVTDIPGTDIIDWILVELRDADGIENATSSTNFDRQALFLRSDGSVVGLDGVNLPRFYPILTNDLYVVIKHRNHLDIISTVSPEVNGRVYSYDFTNGEDKVHGGILAHKHLNTGVWGMATADGDSDSQVGNKDKNSIWYFQQILSGYKQGDFNMNSIIDVNDILLWEGNAGKSGFVPE